MLLLLLKINIYLLDQLRPSALFFVWHSSLCKSKFLTSITFFLMEELLLAFLAEHVCWQWIPPAPAPPPKKQQQNLYFRSLFKGNFTAYSFLGLQGVFFQNFRLYSNAFLHVWSILQFERFLLFLSLNSLILL